MSSGAMNDKKLHVRKCHSCGHINEHGNNVDRCQSCGRAFAPFFYFSEEHASVYADNEVRPPEAPGEMRPIRGLSAVWRDAG